MTQEKTLRAATPNSRPRGGLRINIGPSAEMLALLEADPTADLTINWTASRASEGATSMRAFDVRSEQSANHGCPYCAADFSITWPEPLTDAFGDSEVECPHCGLAMLVPVPIEIDDTNVEVGPAWDILPRIRDRVRALLAEHGDLSVAHAERMARLEDELAEARLHARTDPVTGLLNERAHLEDDAKQQDSAHGVLFLHTVAAVYEHCGQHSGNRIARDAARLLRAANRDRTRLYRIGPAKFALMAPRVDVVRAVLQDIDAAVQSSQTTIHNGGAAPSGANSIEEFLDRHPSPFGLEVRMRAASR